MGWDWSDIAGIVRICLLLGSLAMLARESRGACPVFDSDRRGRHQTTEKGRSLLLCDVRVEVGEVRTS